MKLNINVEKLNTEDRKNKVRKTVVQMEVILNSENFRKKVIAIKSKHGETTKFKNYSNQEIYDLIMSGAEVLHPQVDNELDVTIDDYFSWKRVIGYTMGSIDTIYVNTKYFDKRETKLVGSNILHEYGHKLGFGHDFRSTSRRPFSICYLLNDIYESCHTEIFG